MGARTNPQARSFAQGTIRASRSLKWLLRGSKLLLVMVSDPEFPDRPNVKALEAQIWQLENSWQMIYEPMPEAEADKLLAELFPDASGA